MASLHARHAVLALILGLMFVLQVLTIVPIALVVFPFALIAGIRDPARRERRVMGPLDPPGNQSLRRKP